MLFHQVKGLAARSDTEYNLIIYAHIKHFIILSHMYHVADSLSVLLDDAVMEFSITNNS